MSQEETATALARWLERPAGESPPPDLEPDVVEAIYAVRPDRAPALRLTADDILASVTRGPLAANPAATPTPVPHKAGEVVPFPTRAPRALPEAEPAPRRRPLRWLAFAGGTSSAALALVAAAVLVLVALPSSAPVRFDRSSSEAPAAAPPPAAASDGAVGTDQPSAPPAPKPAAAPAPVAAARSQVSPTVAAAPPQEQVAALPMRDAALYKSNATIPELSEALPDAVADAELDDLPADVGAAMEAKPQDELARAPEKEEAQDEKSKQDQADPTVVRARAVARIGGGDGWRKGIDRATLDIFDAGLADAAALRSAGDLRGAADRLSTLVGAPARAGQHAATLVVNDLLALGDLQGALSVAMRGLALSSADNPERRALSVAYGDVLAASGNPGGAIQAWSQVAGQ